jgi:hypothetical protein
MAATRPATTRASSAHAHQGISPVSASVPLVAPAAGDAAGAGALDEPVAVVVVVVVVVAVCVRVWVAVSVRVCVAVAVVVVPAAAADVLEADPVPDDVSEAVPVTPPVAPPVEDPGAPAEAVRETPGVRVALGWPAEAVRVGAIPDPPPEHPASARAASATPITATAHGRATPRLRRPIPRMVVLSDPA